MTVAQEARAMADAGVLNAVRTLKLEVRQAFIDVQLAQENLALARENAASLQEIVTLNQARVAMWRRWSCYAVVLTDAEVIPLS